MFFIKEPLSTDMDETTIQDAINNLPVFGNEESVTVSRLELATPTFQVTFESKRGILIYNNEK